jgi:hypothetical protein
VVMPVAYRARSCSISRMSAMSGCSTAGTVI